MNDLKPKNVSLKVNNREIPLNAFVKNIVSKVVEGLVDSLDKIPVDKTKIEIIIESEEKK
ncbi:MAG: hypothetical protein QG657_925 [Acidobacteriota bacterium]|nr:hypothetical protein [Acidobacteriota bacterium]